MARRSGASAILAAGGFVVAFDWILQDNTDNEWVSYQVGTINADNGNLTDDDYGILFRNNGGTERFDNNTNFVRRGDRDGTGVREWRHTRRLHVRCCPGQIRE